MPPKIRFTRDNIIQTAFEIAKNEGAENINVRTVSKKLGCSTQPVMYHFKNIEELKDEVYQKADDYHTEYITNIDGNAQDVLKNIGARYIRFAVEEKHLFRFLFQSDKSQKNSIVDINESGEGGKSLPICEMEIELISGEITAVSDLGLLIKEHTSCKPLAVSKLARCLSLLKENDNG